MSPLSQCDLLVFAGRISFTWQFSIYCHFCADLFLAPRAIFRSFLKSWSAIFEFMEFMAFMRFGAVETKAVTRKCSEVNILCVTDGELLRGFSSTECGEIVFLCRKTLVEIVFTEYNTYSFIFQSSWWKIKLTVETYVYSYWVLNSLYSSIR